VGVSSSVVSLFKLMCLIVLYERVFVLLFFFSSRRRHTRSKRDWSSDVCSSDLCGLRPARTDRPFPGAGRRRALRPRWRPSGRSRSEERRVGKESRYRGRTEHKKEKNKRH